MPHDNVDKFSVRKELNYVIQNLDDTPSHFDTMPERDKMTTN